MQAACVIPSYEAAATLAAVVRSARTAVPDLLIIVVDDGSHDSTSDVAKAAGADVVLRHAQNLGKGAALQTGFQCALSSTRNVDVIVTLDADGQHNPAAIPVFLTAIRAGADLVIGARRRLATAMPLHRMLANALSTRAISWCAGQSVRDAQCGYRAVRRSLLESVPHVGERYEAETAFVIRAARAGARIAQTEIPTCYGPPSHFRPVRDAARVIATIWTHRPSRTLTCDSSARMTTVSSPMASIVWSAPSSRSVR
jgi:glycosyltransferase involved in cell wall biosynthesis